MLQPTNLHTLIGGATPGQARIIDLILREQVNLKQSLVLLSRFWKLKIWFSKPIDIVVWTPCRLPTTLIKTDCHVFNKMWPQYSYPQSISWDNRLDSLNLWEWEEIVQAILKQPILHTLIGIHTDLDSLIDRKFKEQSNATNDGTTL